MKRCENCNHPIVRFPLWSESDKQLYPLLRKHEDGSTEFIKSNIGNRWRTMNKANLFKMTFQDISFIAIILVLLYAYHDNTKEAKYIIEHPVEVCKSIGATFEVNPNENSFYNLQELNVTVSSGGG